jgi:hypothetical protein
MDRVAEAFPMAASAVLVIVVAAGEASSAAASGMLAAAESALAAGTSARLVEVSYPSDGAALRVEDEVGARASVALVWEDAARLRARVRLHVAQTDRWTDRLIKFSAADSAHERGRTLGLAVVTMWPEGAAVPRAGSPAAPRPPPVAPLPTAATARGDSGREERARVVAPPPPASTPAAASETRDAAARPERVATVAPPERTELAVEPVRRARVTPREPPVSALPRHALEVGAVASSGVMGAATGYGGVLDGALFVDPALSLRAGIGLRVGPVPELPGSDVTASIGAGLEWWPRPTTSRRRLALGLRAGVLLIRHQVFATAADGGTESYGRFVPAAELMPLLAWALSDGVEVLFGAGAEVAFGTTDIRRGPELEVVARIPPVRVLGQAGLRFRF